MKIQNTIDKKAQQYWMDHQLWKFIKFDIGHNDKTNEDDIIGVVEHNEWNFLCRTMIVFVMLHQMEKLDILLIVKIIRNMRLADNVMRGDFLQDVYQNIGFVYKIDETIHIQLLEGPDVGRSTQHLITPVQLTENFLKKNLLLEDKTDAYNEYFYEDSDPDGVGIYVRAYNDGTFYVEATDKTGGFSKDIQYVHELQHIFKEFNVKKDWVL